MRPGDFFFFFKEDVKLSLFAEGMILYIEEPKTPSENY